MHSFVYALRIGLKSITPAKSVKKHAKCLSPGLSHVLRQHLPLLRRPWSERPRGHEAPRRPGALLNSRRLWAGGHFHQGALLGGLRPRASKFPVVLPWQDFFPCIANARAAMLKSGPLPAPGPVLMSHPKVDETVTIAPLGSQQLPLQAPQAAHGEVSGSNLGHFQVFEILGRGGMGVVYRAVDLNLQRTVALKVLLPQYSTSEERRHFFLREARAAAAVSHPNVAAVYEVGEDRGQIFIAMEFVHGQSLRHCLTEPLPIGEGLRIAIRIARGIECAHECGVLHRDLKPENIMVRTDGEVKILDFGLAKRGLATDGAPDHGVDERRIMGTPGFMSPEQTQGTQVDHRTDIFSLGVLLYELATGTLPFSRSFDQYVTEVLRDERPLPSQRNARVTPELEQIIMRCIARRPDDRYPSVRQVCADLEGLRTGPLRASRVETHPMGSDGATMATGRTSPLPSGTVTLLFCRISELTHLVHERGDLYAEVLGQLDELLRRTVENNNGYIVEATSDGYLFAFTEARVALSATAVVQRVLHTETKIWPQGVLVSMGLHTGVPRLASDRYLGLDVHRTARIAAAAKGGQILLSATTRALLHDEELSEFQVRDLGMHRLTDLRFPEHLFAICASGLPISAEPINTFSTLRNNLPSQPTVFVGRKVQIEEITRLLQQPSTRLVTLTGLGGAGKTRLSLEVGRALLEEFPNGVLQVLLAPVIDPALVPATIAQTLEVPLLADRPVLEILKARIGNDRMLLILDNFEQVINASRAISELLANCPNLRVLITSRQSLKLRGEREYTLPPMHLPPAGEAADVEAISRCESVQLFVDRVRDSLAGFELTQENAFIVADICTRLEGIPLAIELAASRIKMLSLVQLRARLGDRLNFLKGGASDAAERHRALRTAIDWSYRLLTEPEQVLFRRVAVFVGGFSLESAESVCDFEPGGQLDVFGGLSSLVDKSLLARGQVDGESRLVLLETIREYALAQLQSSADSSIVRARHAEHFVTLAEAVSPGLMGHDQRLCVSPMLKEEDNIRAALAWALEQPSATSTSRMLRSLVWFWIPQGRFTEGRKWTIQAVKQARRCEQRRELAEVLDVAGRLAFASGDLAGAVPSFAESLALFEEIGDEVAAARTKGALGATSSVVGPLQDSIRLLEESLAVCRKHSDNLGAGLALNALGELSRGAGNSRKARAFYEEAIKLLRQCDNIFWTSMITSNLVQTHLAEGNWQTAMGLLVEMRDVALEFNYPTVVYMFLAALAGIAIMRGRASDGVRIFAAVENLLAKLGQEVEPADRAEWERHLAAARAALGEDKLTTALNEGTQWTQRQALAAAIELSS